MKKILVAMLAFFAVLNASAVELTGNVTFANGLYTYSYQLSESETPIHEVLVMVNSTSVQYDLKPASVTTPTGWMFHTYGGSVPNDVNAGATYFGWDIVVPAGTAPVSGFSFTTHAPPAAQPLPLTYMLYSPTYNGGPGYLEDFYLGSVVAPDFLIAQAVPEPESYVMLLAGLGLVGALARRSRRSHC